MWAPGEEVLQETLGVHREPAALRCSSSSLVQGKALNPQQLHPGGGGWPAVGLGEI